MDINKLPMYDFKVKVLKALEENTNSCDLIAIHNQDLETLMNDIIEETNN